MCNARIMSCLQRTVNSSSLCREGLGNPSFYKRVKKIPLLGWKEFWRMKTHFSQTAAKEWHVSLLTVL